MLFCACVRVHLFVSACARRLEFYLNANTLTHTTIYTRSKLSHCVSALIANTHKDTHTHTHTHTPTEKRYSDVALLGFALYILNNQYLSHTLSLSLTERAFCTVHIYTHTHTHVLDANVYNNNNKMIKWKNVGNKPSEKN